MREARPPRPIVIAALLATSGALALGCGSGEGTSPDAAVDAQPDAAWGGPFPDPGAWRPNAGPGGPTRTFTTDELYQHCAYLDGGDLDVSDHHNLVAMFDGYLLLPWAPEFGRGGLTFFDISDPCAPTVVGSGTSDQMRETHSVGFSLHGGRWAVVNGITNPLISLTGGIQFWDISDIAQPSAVSLVELPGFAYPDAYARVTLSVFWQVPYVFVTGSDNGVYVVDARNPRNPQLITQYVFEPVLRAGQVQVIGNLLVVTTAEGARTALLDVSDPADPQPIPGGDFLAREADGGAPREAYFTNLVGHHIYYARKEGGGGLMVYDIADPTAPTWAGAHVSDGNGGYVFVHEGFAFTGESNFAAIYDVRDLSAISEVQRLSLTGDLDTMVPIGNVVILSVDDGADEDHGSAVAPWQLEPDATPPAVLWAWPPPDATDLPVTTRLGLSFSELVDPRSAFEGSVRVYREGMPPDDGRVNGWVSAQETIVNFVPYVAFEPGATYVLELPAGGLADVNGNTIAEPFLMSFTIAGP
jgi:hypothetical protein